MQQQEDRLITEALSKGEPLGDPWDAYKKHGEAAREKLKEMVSQVQTKNSKEERKQTMTTVTGANVVLPQSVPDKPKTVAEIIAETRKARHQRIE